MKGSCYSSPNPSSRLLAHYYRIHAALQASSGDIPTLSARMASVTQSGNVLMGFMHGGCHRSLELQIAAHTIPDPRYLHLKSVWNLSASCRGSTGYGGGITLKRHCLAACCMASACAEMHSGVKRLIVHKVCAATCHIVSAAHDLIAFVTTSSRVHFVFAMATCVNVLWPSSEM